MAVVSNEKYISHYRKCPIYADYITKNTSWCKVFIAKNLYFFHFSVKRCDMKIFHAEAQRRKEKKYRKDNTL